MVAWNRDVRNLQKVRLYGTEHFLLDGKVAVDRCPHRGASLSSGHVQQNCVVCPYHGRRFSHETPDMFSGTLKHSALWVGGTDDSLIPHMPEFDDDSYRSIFMTRRLPGINSMAFLEAGIDHEHVSTVHSIKVANILTPEVLTDEATCTSMHVYNTPKVRLTVETTFWAPLSNCLKFEIYDKRKGTSWQPFVLFFSLTPHDQCNATLHIRSMRKKWVRDIDPLLDLLFVAISDVPILEDARVVRGVKYEGITHDCLTPHDNLIALYRKRMRERYPDLVDYFTNYQA